MDEISTACPACGARVPQLATQAEELAEIRIERDYYKSVHDEMLPTTRHDAKERLGQAEELERLRVQLAAAERASENFNRLWHEVRNQRDEYYAQLIKQSAVVEAAKMWAGIWKNQGVSNYLTQAVQDLTTTDTGDGHWHWRFDSEGQHHRCTCDIHGSHADTTDTDYRMSDEPGDLKRKFLDDAL